MINAKPQMFNPEQVINEQKHLLAQFLQLTRAQAQLIAADDTDDLMQNLELRAQVMDKVNALRPELAAVLAEHADDPAVRDLKEQTVEILREISETDEKNRAAARGRMEFFQAEIRRVGDTRKGVGAYIKGAQVFGAEIIDECQ